MDELGYMIQEADKSALQNLSAMGDRLKELKQNMLVKEAEFKQAKNEYEHYANVVLPTEMFAVGVNSIGLESGGVMSVTRNYYCQPNKNDADKRVMAEWLREHGGEHLIESKAEMTVEDAKSTGLPYIEINAMNTARLKAFLKSKLGVDGKSVAEITLEDIPACMHFQEVSSVEIKL